MTLKIDAGTKDALKVSLSLGEKINDLSNQLGDEDYVQYIGFRMSANYLLSAIGEKKLRELLEETLRSNYTSQPKKEKEKETKTK